MNPLYKIDKADSVLYNIISAVLNINASLISGQVSRWGYTHSIMSFTEISLFYNTGPYFNENNYNNFLRNSLLYTSCTNASCPNPFSETSFGVVSSKIGRTYL